jgi:predicted nucleic acid-binding protein
MHETFQESSIRVIDSNVAVWTVVPLVAGLDVTGRVARWQGEGVRLVAPMLWLSECVSAIRGGVYAGVITEEEGRDALDDLFALEVEMVPMNPQHCRSAFEWATRLGQARAYDGFFLTLAEELGAEFWTADRRLVRRAHQVGVAWAHWIGDSEAEE